MARESNVCLATHLPSQTSWPCSLSEGARFAHRKHCGDSESSHDDSNVRHHTLLPTPLLSIFPMIVIGGSGAQRRLKGTRDVQASLIYNGERSYTDDR